MVACRRLPITTIAGRQAAEQLEHILRTLPARPALPAATAWCCFGVERLAFSSARHPQGAVEHSGQFILRASGLIAVGTISPCPSGVGTTASRSLMNFSSAVLVRLSLDDPAQCRRTFPGSTMRAALIPRQPSCSFQPRVQHRGRQGPLAVPVGCPGLFDPGLLSVAMPLPSFK